VANCLQRNLLPSSLFAISIAIAPLSAQAAKPALAQVTSITNDVSLVAPDGAAEAAALRANFSEGTTAKTGGESRAEITFANRTVARLGGRTSFGFENGARSLTLSEGVVLVDAPKRAKGTTIHAGAVATTVTGATVLFEYHPAVYKLVVLQGTARLYRPGHLGDSILVRAGQMVIGKPAHAVSDPVDVDVQRLLSSSKFITEFPELPSAKLLAAAGAKQQRQKSQRALIDTNLVIFGEGNVVSMTAPVAAPPPASSSDVGTVEPLFGASHDAATQRPRASDPTE
jgi:hypothetical protein